MVRLETFEISEQRTAFIWIFAQEVDWCIKDSDKERLQTTAFINVWKIFPGYTGDWFDVKTASTCTTELWDALKSFILESLKIKVAPHPIIVSLDTLSWTYCKKEVFSPAKRSFQFVPVTIWSEFKFDHGKLYDTICQTYNVNIKLFFNTPPPPPICWMGIMLSALPFSSEIQFFVSEEEHSSIVIEHSSSAIKLIWKKMRSQIFYSVRVGGGWPGYDSVVHWTKVQDKGLEAPCREKPLEMSGLEPAAPNHLADWKHCALSTQPNPHLQ